MPTDLTTFDADNFGLASFADLLPHRDHIIGEDPGSFEGFHNALLQSLAPQTAYECVVAENLIAIEWELLQHRRMRDVGLRARIREAIQAAVVNRRQNLFTLEHEADREAPKSFDKGAAEDEGNTLAKLAVSKDLTEQKAAHEEITELGLEPVEVMAEAYRSYDRSITVHEQKLPELERRRREVKRDYDALQHARPVEAEVIEG